MIPLPKEISDLLNHQSNFSLLFTRKYDWNIQGDSISKPDDWISKWSENALVWKSGLNRIHHNQKALLNTYSSLGYACFEFKGTLMSPFITGLGAGHPSETGLVLDRNTGCPYIPASSQKGVLRLARAIQLFNGKPNDYPNYEVPDRDLADLFGDTDHRGKLIILDAFPIGPVKLHVDIMNPHFKPYYQSNEGGLGPIETDNPVPIKFLTVPIGTEFKFRCLLRPGVELEEQVPGIYQEAFENLGLGGKTSVGYGRFDFTDTTEGLRTEWEAERLRKQEEDERQRVQAQEEAAAVEKLRMAAQEQQRRENEIRDLLNALQGKRDALVNITDDTKTKREVFLNIVQAKIKNENIDFNDQAKAVAQGFLMGAKWSRDYTEFHKKFAAAILEIQDNLWLNEDKRRQKLRNIINNIG